MNSTPLTPSALYRLLVETVVFDESWPGGEWPVRGGFEPPEFEIAVGAVLTQNTRWQNVEIVLRAMVAAQLASPETISSCPQGPLEKVLRPAGFFRRKASTLRLLSEFWLTGNRGADGAEKGRDRLLRIPGIGPETADSILLYAWAQPSFIVDAYTRRLLARLGMVTEDLDYAGLQEYFHRGLKPATEGTFRRFHALIVQHGKSYCRRTPLCDFCPLESQCPGRMSPGRAAVLPAGSLAGAGLTGSAESAPAAVRNKDRS